MLIPPCKEVFRLNSERFERRLTWRERLQIRLHLRVCEACRAVEKQLRFIHEAMRRYREGETPPAAADNR